MKTTLAAGVALALSASALAAPQAFAADSSSLGSISDLSATNAVLTSGQLTWPVKQSFISYINRSADSTKGTGVFVKDQAKFDAATANFTFPLDVKDSKLDAKGNGTLEFNGDVTLRAHAQPNPAGGFAYGLDINLDDVKVKVEGTKATITADYNVKGMGRDGKALNVEKDDAALGTFTLANAIDPTKPEFKIADSAVTYGADIAGLGLKPGETPEDAKASLDVKFTPLSETGETLKIVGIVIGVLAGLGALAAALLGPLKELLPIQLPF